MKCFAIAVLASALLLPGCGGDNNLVLADAEHDEDATSAARAAVLAHTADLRDAVTALCAAAPAPSASGWSATSDPAAVGTMRDEWRRARRAYQSVEGLMDMFLGDLDARLDIRYDDALAAGADTNPFNDEGFVGLHAVERILWSDQIPASVVAAESALDGYVPASFPANEEQAADFRDELCARLVADASALHERMEALALGSPALYEAAVRLVEAQAEKLGEAAAGKDESRYAGYTLGDMRANLASAKETHAIFRAWLLTKADGAHVDGEIAEGFARLDQAYAAVAGDALPETPEGWSPVDPTHAAQASPFGVLYAAASAESDDTIDGSLAHSMDEAAGLLGIGE